MTRTAVHDKQWQMIPQERWHVEMASIPVGDCVASLPYIVSPGVLKLQVPFPEQRFIGALDQNALPANGTFKIMQFQLTTVELDQGEVVDAWRRVA